jgi:aryl-alcohol dehydrogenase-like predicted oxidoreductase
MEYTKLGKTEIEVSMLSMGCWTIGGGPTWGDPDDADSIATIHAALDAGVNFFDTAEAYGDGHSETILGQALQGQRENVVIATKVSRKNLAPKAVQQACEASLQRLKTDYIDLYQIHWSNPSIPLAETLEALERLREQGKIRAIGVSNFGVADLSEYLKIGRCETNQLPYNLLWRAIEFEITQKCLDEEVAILCYSALAQALLTGKFSAPDEFPEGRARSRYFSKNRPHARHGEDGCEAELFATIAHIREICETIHEPMARVAIAWLLHQPGVTSVIAGARTSEQIRHNVQGCDLKLSPDIIAELNSVTDELKQKLGPNPDMWQAAPSRFR